MLLFGHHEGEEAQAKSAALSVFSGDKLESLIKIAVVYKINEKKLQELHDMYEFGYRDVLRGKVIDAIKNTAPEFQTPFFFQNRTFISTRLSAAVDDRIVNPETGFDRQLDLIDVYFGQVEVPVEVSSKQVRPRAPPPTNPPAGLSERLPACPTGWRLTDGGRPFPLPCSWRPRSSWRRTSAPST